MQSYKIVKLFTTHQFIPWLTCTIHTAHYRELRPQPKSGTATCFVGHLQNHCSCGVISILSALMFTIENFPEQNRMEQNTLPKT